jgi:hypothetical protein
VEQKKTKTKKEKKEKKKETTTRATRRGEMETRNVMVEAMRFEEATVTPATRSLPGVETMKRMTREVASARKAVLMQLKVAG